MENKCRAKDPNTCRTHGTNPVQNENVMNAVAAGDADAYMNARVEMDKKAPSRMDPKTREIPQKAWEAAAKAGWEKGGTFKWKDVSPEEKKALIENERIALEAAVAHMPDGVVTDEAVEAMAISHRTTSGRGDWDSLYPNMKNQYFENARHILKAAAPHMGIALNGKSAIRAMFNKMFG